ncbi:MAG: bifunctional tetrahydrofolate synthase/dihydrofolate synthase [Burkholderiaceae bacterium]
MTTPRTLDEWLAHCERLHAKPMDFTLERVKAVRERLGIRFDCPLITVAGTNGKGSTCAMIESIALRAGYRVGLHIKPHLVRFEERCRIDGELADAATLVPHFEAVEAARGDITLTYFEFTLLAIVRAFQQAALDLIILEVGLGGRLDAVNAFDTDCAVITSVSIDHVEWLGNDRESIGREKAGIMRAGKPAIVSDPEPPASVIEAARAVGADLWLLGRDFNVQGDRRQWAWAGRGRRYHALAYPALRGANQLLNAAGALAALDALRDRLPVSAQAVREGFAQVELQGRFQIVPGQPVIVLDVAHNAQSVAALVANLDQMGFYPRTHAVFGVMADKDIASVLRQTLPLVDAWYLTALPIARAAKPDALLAQLREAARSRTVDASCHDTPGEALRSAVSRADPADRIVVFGSFYTVGGVLKDGLPRTAARHLG